MSSDEPVDEDANEGAPDPTPTRRRLSLPREQVALIVASSVAVIALLGWFASSASLRGDNDIISARLEKVTAERDASFSRYADLREQYVTVSNAAEAAEARTVDLEARESAIAAREAAATAAQQELRDNQITSGVWRVGQDVAAGTYRSVNNDGCYYAYKDGVGPDADILDNGFVDGPAVVTLVDGQVFDTSGCSVWQKE